MIKYARSVKLIDPAYPKTEYFSPMMMTTRQYTSSGASSNARGMFVAKLAVSQETYVSVMLLPDCSNQEATTEFLNLCCSNIVCTLYAMRRF